MQRTARNNVGVGRGRGITARGRTVGLRGNISRQGAPQAAVVAAAVAAQRGATAQGAPPATGGVRGVGQIRPSARGTQHAKPLQNLPDNPNEFSKETRDGQQWGTFLSSMQKVLCVH
uniref:Uncharacterized protein n=1 Tax=Glossina morsitans morsitans TaxID=37546 RepID=A0A1B0G1B7_GLOMM